MIPSKTSSLFNMAEEWYNYDVWSADKDTVKLAIKRENVQVQIL